VTEAYDRIEDNRLHRVKDAPLPTFSIDVDTASYSNLRRLLNAYRLPPPDAVRIEELINYFPYSYTEPDGEHPFSVTLDSAPCPWKPEHRLVRIGLQGREVAAAARPRANLVFLLDVSGSMAPDNKLRWSSAPCDCWSPA
jgi:Ca-activated chloride channel family protein